MLGACSGPTFPTGPGDDPTTGDTGDTTTPVGTGRGSIVVAMQYPWVGNGEPTTAVAGAFTSEDPGIENLAQCLLGIDPWCATELPSGIGSQVPLRTVEEPAPPLEIPTVDAGAPLRVGGVTIPRTIDEDTGAATYRSEVAELVGFDGDPTIGVSAPGGDWPGFDLADVVAIPTPMSVQSHDPMRSATFYDADEIDLRWLAGEVGTVELLVRTEAGQSLIQLDDDGQHTLSLTPLGLADGSSVELQLLRSDRTEVETAGGLVDVTVQSSRRVTGTYRTIGTRPELTDRLVDSCAEAEASDTVGAGFYRGNFSSFTNDLDPGPTGCTGLQASAPDAIVPIEVPPDSLLEADFLLRNDDASVYLVTDCNLASSCLVGADDWSGVAAAGEETLSYTNDTPLPQRVYLVLDGFDRVTSDFQLAIRIRASGGDILQNYCADAIEQGSIPGGRYSGTLADHLDILPSYPSTPCMSPGMFGGEGVARIFLRAGATVRATVETPGAEPMLHLLSNCSVSASCFLASEGEIEWTNNTAFAQTFFLVLDSGSGIGEYALDVQFE